MNFAAKSAMLRSSTLVKSYNSSEERIIFLLNQAGVFLKRSSFISEDEAVCFGISLV